VDLGTVQYSTVQYSYKAFHFQPFSIHSAYRYWREVNSDGFRFASLVEIIIAMNTEERIQMV